jgi:hypothetical protein
MPSCPEFHIRVVSMCASCYYTSLSPRTLRTSPDTRSSSPPQKKRFGTTFLLVFFTLRDASRNSNEYLSWDLYAGDQIEAFRWALSLDATRYLDKTGELGSSQSHVSVKGLFVAIHSPAVEHLAGRDIYSPRDREYKFNCSRRQRASYFMVRKSRLRRRSQSNKQLKQLVLCARDRFNRVQQAPRWNLSEWCRRMLPEGSEDRLTNTLFCLIVDILPVSSCSTPIAMSAARLKLPLESLKRTGLIFLRPTIVAGYACFTRF